jgi:DNA-directed RNA polymerase specialized sigma24 family protein
METDSLPAGGAFPATRRSVVLAVGSAEEEVRRQAFGALVTAYWKPVYKLLRLKWRLDPAAAEDATQEFFARALEKGWFARYEPRRARFRTFLRSCLDGFAANRHKAARRQKRGGGAAPLALDFAGAEGELAFAEPTAPLDPDELFHREWVRHLFGLAVERLRRRLEGGGHALRFRLFARYDLEDGPGGEADAQRPSYADLAAEHGVPVTRVTNELAAARRALRREVLDLLREVTGSEREFREEARALLGVEVEAP